MITAKKITPADARLIAVACEQTAMEIGQDMDIAVADDGGNLLFFQDMDNGRITSIHIAIDKAWTAAAVRKSTRDYGNVAQSGIDAFVGSI